MHDSWKSVSEAAVSMCFLEQFECSADSFSWKFVPQPNGFSLSSELALGYGYVAPFILGGSSKVCNGILDPSSSIFLFRFFFSYFFLSYVKDSIYSPAIRWSLPASG